MMQIRNQSHSLWFPCHCFPNTALLCQFGGPKKDGSWERRKPHGIQRTKSKEIWGLRIFRKPWNNWMLISQVRSITQSKRLPDSEYEELGKDLEVRQTDTLMNLRPHGARGHASRRPQQSHPGGQRRPARWYQRWHRQEMALPPAGRSQSQKESSLLFWNSPCWKLWTWDIGQTDLLGGHG